MVDFSDHTPWLGVNPNYKEINAASQMANDSSVFRFYQKLTSLRKEHPVMAHGDLQLCCPEDGPVIAYTRSYQGETWLAVHNFSAGCAEIPVHRNRSAAGYFSTFI